ncbi:SpoIIE family protein phosphatase [Pseudomonadota bacterium]
MHSLRTKLVLTISALIVVLFGLASWLFIGDKQTELTEDIFKQARAFGELTATETVNDYNLFLAQKSFVYFNREIQDLFSKFSDLESVKVISYNGEMVYDSETEQEKQYEGTSRALEVQDLLAQVQAKNASVKTLAKGRVIYLKKNEDGGISYVDENEQEVRPLGRDEKISYLVQPGSDEFSVVYGITYENLQSRINTSLARSALLVAFGVGISILIAFFYANSMTTPLHRLTKGAKIIAKGDFKHRVEIKTKDEISVLGKAFNQMAIDLDKSTKAMLYKERVTKELELAAQIQKELLPKEIPKMPGLDISAGLLPAEEIGGDCYDFLKVDDKNLVFYLGDVTGHGVPAGIVVSIANALIYNAAGHADMTKILVDVNEILKAKTTSSMFLTLVMMHWNSVENRFQYVSAGHEQLIHYHAKDRKITLAPAGGIALGMIPDIGEMVQMQEIQLEPGDAIVAYSDGIPEAWKNEKEYYGMARFKRAVSEYSDLPTAISIRNALIADVKEFTGKYKQQDDITVMVMKKPEESA